MAAHTRHRLAGRVAAALAAATLATVVHVATTDTASAAAQQEASIDLEGQTTYVRAGVIGENEFRVNARLRAPADALVRVRVYPAVESAGEFFGSLAELSRYFFELEAAPIVRDAAGLTSLAFTTRISNDPAIVRAPTVATLDVDGGVYPVQVAILDAEGTVLTALTTYLIELPDPPDPAVDEEPTYPLSIALVAPFTAPLATAADGTVDIGADDLTRLRGLASALASYPDVPATLAPRPETIRALDGSAQGADVVELLRSSLAGREVLASTLVDLDPARWTEAGLMDRFGDSLELGRRTLDDVLGVPSSTATWLAGPTLDEAAVVALDELGVEQFVVREEDLVALEEPRDLTLTQPFHIGAGPEDGVVPAVQLDGLIGFWLSAPNDLDLAVHQLLAHLAVLRNEQAGAPRGMPLLLPEIALPDAVYVALLEALAPRTDGTAVFEAVTLSDLFATVELAREDRDDESGDAAAPRLERELDPEPFEPLASELGPLLDGTAADIADYLSVVERPGEGAQMSDLLALAASDELFPSARATYLDTVEATIDQGLDGIDAPEDQTITLTAREATLPLQFTNTQDTTATVALNLESDRLEFPDGEVQIVELPPGESTHDLRVRSRAAGDAVLAITVSSPNGTRVLDESSVVVRSTVFSGVGLVISAVALAFLALWWGREIARSRRTKRAAAAESHPARRVAEGLASPDDAPPEEP